MYMELFLSYAKRLLIRQNVAFMNILVRKLLYIKRRIVKHINFKHLLIAVLCPGVNYDRDACFAFVKGRLAVTFWLVDGSSKM